MARLACVDAEYAAEDEDTGNVEREAAEAGVTATGANPRWARAKVAPAARRRSK